MFSKEQFESTENEWIACVNEDPGHVEECTVTYISDRKQWLITKPKKIVYYKTVVCITIFQFLTSLLFVLCMMYIYKPYSQFL